MCRARELRLRYVRGRTLGVRRPSGDRRPKGRADRDASQGNYALGRSRSRGNLRLGGTRGLRQRGQVRMAAVIDMRRVMRQTFAIRQVPRHPVGVIQSARGAARLGERRGVISSMSDRDRCCDREQRVDLRLLMSARPCRGDPRLGAVIVYVCLTGFEHVRGQRERHSRGEAAAKKSERAERAKHQSRRDERDEISPYVPQRAPNVPDTRWTVAVTQSAGLQSIRVPGWGSNRRTLIRRLGRRLSDEPVAGSATSVSSPTSHSSFLMRTDSERC